MCGEGDKPLVPALHPPGGYDVLVPGFGSDDEPASAAADNPSMECSFLADSVGLDVASGPRFEGLVQVVSGSKHREGRASSSALASAAGQDAALGTAPLPEPPQRMLFAALAARIFVYHCGETLVKEKLFALPGFRYAEALSFVNTVLLAILALGCSRTAPAAGRRTPLRVYLLLGALAAASHVTTNLATLHLSVITQLVLKSSKVLWVMVARRVCLAGKRHPVARQWAGAACIVVGAVLLSAGTVATKRRDGDAADALLGLLYLCVSLACDACVYVVEEGVCFGTYGAAPTEVILYMKLFALLPSAGFWLGSGTVGASVAYLQETPLFWVYAVVYGVLGYAGAWAVLSMIEAFNGATAAAVCSCRKVASILLSYVIFPRAMSVEFGFGAAMMIGGATLAGGERRGQHGAPPVTNPATGRVRHRKSPLQLPLIERAPTGLSVRAKGEV